MAFDIRFYNCPDKNNIINKTKNNEKVLRGELRNVSSIYNPTIIIHRNDDILNKNYVEIPRFNRFYYITDIVLDNDDMIINLKCDVLESFKDDFMDTTQIIGRQETAFNKYLEDSNIPKYNKLFTQIKQVGTSPFNTEGQGYEDIDRYNYILIVSNLEP